MLSLSLQRHFGSWDLDCSLVWRGEGICGLFGPSGSGKSTLLRAIAGLDRRAGDRLTWRGAELGPLPPERRAIGLVFQDARLFSHLTVRGNLLLAAGKGRGRWPMEALAERLGFRELLDKPAPALSGGQRQRVALARALLAEPTLLLLDEPFSALDRRSRLHLIHELQQLQRESDLPMLYVTHAMEEVSMLCDELILIEEGRALAQGGPDALFARLDLPLAARDDGGVILCATLKHWCPEEQMAELDVDGQSLFVTMPLPPDAPGPVRIKVAARDVVIATRPIEGSSLSNCLSTRLREEREGLPGQSLLQLGLGQQILLARITRRSSLRLALEGGQELFAYIKAVSLLGEA
ncbi:molybdenum ABC transporter ATP-binding protein [Aeromonas simiae]|uniref:molybdenum ABC transporter ATP-binding protein n=1 Tax=Aeromonas simiae TaxID=218936 RepID=UPI0005AB63B0|nr:molybdenum ABC transporter ATP-binding protein [Aeromonas simiae]